MKKIFTILIIIILLVIFFFARIISARFLPMGLNQKVFCDTHGCGTVIHLYLTPYEYVKAFIQKN